MLAVIFLTGLLLGIVITTVTIFAYTAAIEMREEEARQRREELKRRNQMKREQNRVRDEQERAICEETRKAIQRRDEHEGRS